MDDDTKRGESFEALPASTEAPAARPPKGEKKQRHRPRDPALARAFRSGRPVQGKVLRVIKGGYEVRVGRSRAFCPHSQMDLRRVNNPEELVGRSYLFKVNQFRRGGEDVVLSRRALLEEDRADEAKAVRATLLEGAVVQGKVTGTAEFGAFVDLGAGVMGLVHISELSHSRVDRVSEVVKVGDTITVRILKLHKEDQRISLSARQAENDPWQHVADSFKAGQVCPGTVLRLTDFGAFVELSPGVEALAPAREFPPQPGGWEQGLEPGRQADWLVLSVHPEQRRISVAPAPEDPAAAAELKIEVGATLRGRVQKIEKYGVFVWLGPGRVGLMPNIWAGEPGGADLGRRFPIGKEIEVEVMEVGEDGRRIRLSKKGLGRRKAESKPRVSPPTSRVPKPRASKRAVSNPPASFGTSLGEALKAALDRRDG